MVFYVTLISYQTSNSSFWNCDCGRIRIHSSRPRSGRCSRGENVCN